MKRTAGLALAALCAVVCTVPALAGETLTLDEAVRRAAADHPEVRSAEAELRVAQAELVQSRALPNPELGLAVDPRATPAGRGRDYDATLSQPLELGKRGPRSTAAERRGEAAAARLEWARAQAASSARRAYLLVLVAAQRAAAARRSEEVAEELKAATRERLDAGSGTLLEANVAAAAAGRARAERLAAQRRQRHAAAELAAATGVAAAPAVDPAQALPALDGLGVSADELVARALAQRADLRAVRLERAAAAADSELARALARPDPVLQASYERAERRLLVGVTVALPLWNRSRGRREAATASQQKAVFDEEATAGRVERDVRAAWEAWQLAREAVAGFDREVVARMDENVELARESLEAGKIGLFDFNLLRRDLVETQLAYLDALADLVEARHSLELAAGVPVQ